MASPMRLSEELVSAAEREASLQKRSVPKQIEFWAYLGKAVENIVNYSDIMAIQQGLKKISIEPIASEPVDAQAVFDAVASERADGRLGRKVTGAVVYYEASRSRPGLLDQVNSATGERITGQFRDGKFTAAA